MSTIDYCISTSKPLFKTSLGKPVCLSSGTSTGASGLQFVQNVGTGAEVHQETVNGVAKLRTIKAFDNSIVVNQITDEICLNVETVDGGLY